MHIKRRTVGCWCPLRLKWFLLIDWVNLVSFELIQERERERETDRKKERQTDTGIQRERSFNCREQHFSRLPYSMFHLYISYCRSSYYSFELILSIQVSVFNGIFLTIFSLLLIISNHVLHLLSISIFQLQWINQHFDYHFIPYCRSSYYFWINFVAIFSCSIFHSIDYSRSSYRLLINFNCMVLGYFNRRSSYQLARCNSMIATF